MRGNVQAIQATSEKLIRDVRTVVDDAEDLIKATAGDFGDRTREARAKLAGALVVARETCNKLEDRVFAGAQATNHLIRDHPLESVGIAFAVGLLVGIFLSRNS